MAKIRVRQPDDREDSQVGNVINVPKSKCEKMKYHKITRYKTVCNAHAHSTGSKNQHNFGKL
jgi:hypothetical protein